MSALISYMHPSEKFTYERSGKKWTLTISMESQACDLRVFEAALNTVRDILLERSREDLPEEAMPL